MVIDVCCTSGRSAKVEAAVFGEWAVHPGIDGDDLSLRLDWWVVTHVPSGRTIVSAVGRLDEASATELARALGERVPRGIVPHIPFEVSFQELPADVKRRIRSVIFDVRGEVIEP